MLGNDVVDLRDPETRPETFRPRFDERVFDAAERRAIERDEDPHARRWLHWAAKEAAYKLARQIDGDFFFAPSKLVAKFEAPLTSPSLGFSSSVSRFRPSGQRERSGSIALSGVQGFSLCDVELRCIETAEYVHVVALPAGGDWEAVVAVVAPIEEGADASAAVRLLAADGVARDLGIPTNRVAIGRRGRIPTIEIDGAPSTLAISLSHHGGYMASAVMPLRGSEIGPREAPVSKGAGDLRLAQKRVVM